MIDTFPNLVVLGKSGSGKTSVASWLQVEYGYTSYGSIPGFKRYIEEVYGLPYGALEDRKYKSFDIGGGKTIQDILIGFHSFMNEYDELFETRSLIRNVTEAWTDDAWKGTNTRYVFHGLRNAVGMSNLIELAESFDKDLVCLLLEDSPYSVEEDTSYEAVTKVALDRGVPIYNVANGDNLPDLNYEVLKTIEAIRTASTAVGC